MKVKPKPASKAPTQPDTRTPPALNLAELGRGWKPAVIPAESRPKPATSFEAPNKTGPKPVLVDASRNAHAQNPVATQHASSSGHPMVERFGEALGLGLGVIVTEALSVVPSWNKPVLDERGMPVASVEGATRTGQHDILQRHTEVVGPKVTALVDKLRPGMVHDLLEGFGKGATAAPGTSYRLEAAMEDLLGKPKPRP